MRNIVFSSFTTTQRIFSFFVLFGLVLVRAVCFLGASSSIPLRTPPSLGGMAAMLVAQVPYLGPSTFTVCQTDSNLGWVSSRSRLPCSITTTTGPVDFRLRM